MAKRNEDPKDVVETTLVRYEHHLPGAPLETREQREAREAFADHKLADSLPEPAVEYDGIDTREPHLNLATRSNIVPAGPGSVEDWL